VRLPAPDRHDERDDAVDPLGRTLLRRLDVARGVLLDLHVVGHPGEDGIAAVAQLRAEEELLQLPRRC
jgi:hypothetical protein